MVLVPIKSSQVISSVAQFASSEVTAPISANMADSSGIDTVSIWARVVEYLLTPECLFIKAVSVSSWTA